jgi:hypothetical protein
MVYLITDCLVFDLWNVAELTTEFYVEGGEDEDE